MGDLSADTEVKGSDGRYRAELSRDWEIWGPNGGYLVGILLRAAGAHCGLPRPVSIACHFLGVADFRPVDLEVVTLRQGRRSASMRVSMTQDGSPVCEALVWAAAEAEPIEGFGHDDAAGPDVPGVDGLADLRELLAEGEPLYRFWENFDYRPLDWMTQEEWLAREPGAPRARAWLRYRPRATFDDPWVEATRTALLLDTFMWPAAARAYTGEMGFMAPSMDVAVQFHRLDPSAEWLLIDAHAPLGSDGLIGGVSYVWSEDGRLLASGIQQMLVRGTPAPRPEPVEPPAGDEAAAASPG
ncbi:MAG TPA: thioesterase family protein [Acidimicrobiia bacterium]|nr:thioesterase family protein [Acidimicrobiia bacterium]